MNVSNNGEPLRSGSTNAELHLGGKRLLLCPVPTPVTPSWHARLAYWASSRG